MINANFTPENKQKKPEDKEKKPEKPESEEMGGRGGLDPSRFGDWEINGRCVDF